MGNRPKLSKPVVRASATDRVVVAYIHPGQVSSYFAQSLVNMLMFDQATSRRVVGCINEWSSANVSSSRNSLTAQFLDERDADWLLWIDSDMAFEHTALEQLLAAADKDERPVMGGLCFGMSEGRLFPTIYHFITREDGGITTVRAGDYPEGIVACAATGAAFVLVHRSVLEKIRAQGFNEAFPWFQETELGGQPAGEDITFCIRAGIVGAAVHVDTRVRIGHHKSAVLDHDGFQAQRQGVADVSPDAREG